MTLLFGPLLRILHRLAPKSARGPLQDTHKEFLNATILIAISVLIATIVYVKQADLLFEVTFLYYLVTMQFLALLGTALSTLQFWKDRPKKANFKETVSKLRPKERQFWRDRVAEMKRHRQHWQEQTVIITLTCFIGFGLYLGSLSLIRGQSVSLSLLPELISSCSSYGQIVPDIPAATSPAPNINWNLLNHMWTTIHAPGNFIVCLIFVLIIIVAVVLLIAAAVGTFMALLRILAHSFGNSLITLAFAIGVLFCAGQMQVKRNDLRELAGETYTDSQWGFGQVVAVFVWIPTTLRLITRWIETADHQIRRISKLATRWTRVT